MRLRLEEIRTERDLSQQEVAQGSGIQPELYAKYESGMRNPTLEHIVALSLFLKASIDYIVCLTDDPRRQWYDVDFSYLNK